MQRTLVAALVAAAALAVSACTDDGGRSDESSARSTQPGSALRLPPPDGPLMLSCGEPPVFAPSALESPVGAEAEASGPAAALRANRRGFPLPPGPWRELARTEDQVLYGTGDPNLPLEQQAFQAWLVERRESVWEVSRGGNCVPRPVRQGLSSAEWRMSEPHDLDPQTTRFTALVEELACTGGRSSEGRVYPPEIEYTEQGIVVVFWVQPLPDGGVQTCPGNPPTSYEVRLREPLGDRHLLDGGVYPAREPRLGS